MHFQIALTYEHMSGFVEFCLESSEGSWQKRR